MNGNNHLSDNIEGSGPYPTKRTLLWSAIGATGFVVVAVLMVMADRPLTIAAISLHSRLGSQLQRAITLVMHAAAVWGVGGFVLLWIGLYYRLRDKDRFISSVYRAVIALVFSFGFCEAIKLLFPRDRPFVALGVPPLFTHAGNAAFPSDYSSVCFALVFALLAYSRRLSLIGLALAIVISIARFYCRIHWLSDVLVGGPLSGAIAIIFVNWLMRRWTGFGTEAHETESSMYLLLTIARFAVWFGVVLRFASHRDRLTLPFFFLPSGMVLLGTLCFNLLAMAWALWHIRSMSSASGRKGHGFTYSSLSEQNSSALEHERFILSQVLLDCTFYTVYYALTGSMESDFFVFFLIPLFSGVVFLGWRHSKYMWLYISGFQLAAISLIAAETAVDSNQPRKTDRKMEAIVGNVVLPRVFSFAVAGTLLSTFVHKARAIRSHQQIAYSNMFLALANKKAEDDILATLMDNVSLLGYSRARLWLVDPDHRNLVSSRCVGEHSSSDRFNRGGFSIALTDHKAGDATAVFVAGKAKRFRYVAARKNQSLSDDIVKWLFRWQSSSIIDEVTNQDLYRHELDKEDVAVWAEVPLLAGEDILGKLSIDNKGSDIPILDTDIMSLDILVKVHAYKIEKARMLARVSELARDTEEARGENSQLMQRLSETIAARDRMQKDAAWKLFSQMTGHKVGQPAWRLDAQMRKLRATCEHMPQPTLDLIDSMKEDIDETIAIIEEFQSFAEVDDVELRPTHLRPMLDGAAKEATDRGFQVFVRAAPQLPRVLAHPYKIRHCLRELVINANAWRDKEPSMLTISARLLDLDEHPAGLPTDHQYVEIGFEDNGCGVQEAEKPRIFLPFVSARKPGTGLGLAILSGIVRAHGGAVIEDGVPGDGAHFRIYLRRVDDDAEYDAVQNPVGRRHP
jgi:signal transduction histidine kinase/membrane-associated phospholipid phosphatase